MATEHLFSTSQLSGAKPDDKNGQIQHQILFESLTFLYRSMPIAALGNIAVGSFIVFALQDLVSPLNLYV
jgi:hypothetical protein